MLRRLSFSAALAALTVPVLLGPLVSSGPASADGGSTPTDDPAVQSQLRKQIAKPAPRKAAVSRKANRARADDKTPLSVTIDQLTPSTIPDQGMVRVSGFVTNDDTEVWSTINVYAFISDQPLTNAQQLADAVATPPDTVVGSRVGVSDTRRHFSIPELAPGQSLPYTISIPRSLLHVSTPGVYWFGVHALGESPEGRDQLTDGRARTFLPLVPEARPGVEPMAIAIPLRHQLTYAADGSIDDLESWTQSLSQGGRLHSLVDFGASSGGRTVTWLVDPGLVDAVRRIAAGNPPRSLAANLQPGEADGEDVATDAPSDSASPSEEPTPSPTADPEAAPDSPLDLDALDPAVRAAAQAAQAWLARLASAMRPEDQVMALPYGDLDVSGAAEHDPQLYQRAVARAGSTLPGFDVTTTPVLSSPSGFLSKRAIADAAPGSTILLTDAMFPDPSPALATVAGQHVVVTSSGAGAGGPGPDSRTALTAMRQRLLAEAAVRFLRGDQAPLTMVLPHDWVPPEAGGSFFNGLDADWLDVTSVAAVSRAGASTPVDGTALHYPRSQKVAELDQPNFDAADELIRSGVALQNLLTLNNIVSGAVTDEALGSASYSARTRPIASRAATDQSREWIAARLRKVQVEAPPAVTLSSSSGRFQPTIINGLDQPVTVSIEAKADGKLVIDGPQRVQVPAHSRQAVLLTARTHENGIHHVTLVVTDKHGTPLGATSALTIRSAQVSNVIWLFLGIGSALLFGAVGIRLYRRIRSARRTPEEPADAPDAEEPAGHKQTAGAGTR